MKTLKEKFAAGWAIILFVAIITCLILFFASGCKSTRHVVKTSTKVDSTYFNSLIDSNRLLKVENSTLLRQLKESQYSGVVYQDRCDTALLRRLMISGLYTKDEIDNYIQQIAECRNEIEILSDGTLRAKGQIKSASVSKEKLETVIEKKNRTIDSLTVAIATAKGQVIKETETKTIVKKVSTFNIWYYVACFILGMVFWARFGANIKSFFKTIIPKKL